DDQAGGFVEVKLGENPLYGFHLLLQARIGGVHDVEEEVGVRQLFQGGAEGGDEVRRQVGDEAHRVGDDHLALAGEAQTPAGGVERHEELVRRLDVAAGHGVQERALAGVGVADDRKDGHRLFAAAAAPQVALARQSFDLLFQTPDAVANPPAADLDHGLARSAPADAAGQAREAGVLVCQPRQRVLELRELDLELAVAAAGALGEDVEDELCAVDRLEARGVLEGSRLGRLEIDVEDGDRGPAAHGFENALLKLPLTHDGMRVNLRALLADGAGDGDTGRADQLQHLLEVLVLRDDAHHQGALLVGLAGVAGNAGKFGFQRAHRGVHVEAELMDVRRLDALEGKVRGERRKMRQLQAAGQTGVQHLDHGDEVETEERQVVEVVAGERLTLQVSVDEAQAAETADAAAQTADVGQRQAVGVSHDDVADLAIATQKHADLTVEAAGDLGQVAGQLGGDHLPGIDPAAVGALQGADLGRLDTTDVAVDLGDGSLLRVRG